MFTTYKYIISVNNINRLL